MTVALESIEFPNTIPQGVEVLEEEPKFDPSRHLQLEPSEHVYRLDDFGYTDEEIGQCPSNIAVAGPFRILSGRRRCRAARRFQTLADF